MVGGFGFGGVASGERRRKRRRHSLRGRRVSHIKPAVRTLQHRLDVHCATPPVSINFFKMQSSTIMILSVSVIAMLVVWTSPVNAVPMPECAPSVLMTADARYRKVCLVLSQLQDALDAPPEDRDPFEPIDTGIKRKDVDHVFLRFGRPRM